jgi:hypothetical protein
MTTWPQHSNAPITDAIIDIRVSPVNGKALEKLKEIPYPRNSERQQQVEITGHISVDPGQALAASSKAVTQQLGFIFRCAETPYIFQARLLNLTLAMSYAN